jgi:hypothetical protein
MLTAADKASHNSREATHDAPRGFRVWAKMTRSSSEFIQVLSTVGLGPTCPTASSDMLRYLALAALALLPTALAQSGAYGVSNPTGARSQHVTDFPCSNVEVSGGNSTLLDGLYRGSLDCRSGATTCVSGYTCTYSNQCTGFHECARREFHSRNFMQTTVNAFLARRVPLRLRPPHLAPAPRPLRRLSLLPALRLRLRPALPAPGIRFVLWRTLCSTSTSRTTVGFFCVYSGGTES